MKDRLNFRHKLKNFPLYPVYFHDNIILISVSLGIKILVSAAPLLESTFVINKL